MDAIKKVDDIRKVEFENPTNHLDDSKVTVGMITKQRLRKLLDEGDISVANQRKFYEGVRAFYVKATSQALQKLPFDDCVLNHARFLNFERKEECTFDPVEFFCAKYSDLLQFTPAQMDKLQEEFVDYQLLEKNDIPNAVWKEAIVYEEGAEGEEKQYHRMDTIWGYISHVRNCDASCRFQYLSKVAKLILIIPHSNAGEERVFNLIKQNKTPTRSSLHVNGTLSSIIQVKLANKDSCVVWEPRKELLKSAKGATKQYNDMHKK